MIIELLEFISELLNLEFVLSQAINLDVGSHCRRVLEASSISSIVHLASLNRNINSDSFGCKVLNQLISFSCFELIQKSLFGVSEVEFTESLDFEANAVRNLVFDLLTDILPLGLNFVIDHFNHT